jgi:hypothetical protein
MRTLLICHADDLMNRVGLARWLASFSDLVGVIVLDETRGRLWKRVRRELRRGGGVRFLDVLAFRLYYKVFLARRDQRWEDAKLDELCQTYPELPSETQFLHTHSPNTPQAEDFVRRLAPDLMIARCKTLLKQSLFSLPTKGTLVMHPGVCPEYRNAHGCFWALAQNDLANVGMTLLKINKGVDTGPVYGYYRCTYNELTDSHIIIQHKVVLDNLDTLRAKLLEIGQNGARPLDTTGRRSGEWGQPWLTAYWRWKSQARRRRG